MNRRVVTADDVLRVVGDGGTEVVVAPEDRLTPLARDLVHDHGLRLVRAAGGEASRAAADVTSARPPASLPPLRHVPGVARMPLDPFPVDLGRPEMDVRATDVVTAEHGMPMSAGVMSLREGSFDWTLDYDEIQYVLEGELHITRGRERAVGVAGDVIAVPRGSTITFSTPAWAKFMYVTYPADWGGSS
jgi:ethanolamine utilization protein EutQ